MLARQRGWNECYRLFTSVMDLVDDRRCARRVRMRNGRAGVGERASREPDQRLSCVTLLPKHD